MIGTFTPWVRHILGPTDARLTPHLTRSCILCGRDFAWWAEAAETATEVFEHDGRLFLGTPPGNVVRCTDAHPVTGEA